MEALTGVLLVAIIATVLFLLFIRYKVNKIKKKEVSVSENERISEQFICFYPNILVEYVEKTEKVFDRPITIFEGRIEFDSDVIKNKMIK